MTDSIAQSPDLLNIAKDVLDSYGFTTERTRTEGGVDVVLAENPLFIIALGAVATLDSIGLLETEVGALLAERIEASEVASKRWDTYLVLLTTQRPIAQVNDTLFEIAYDTRRFRRIVRVGLLPTTEAVTSALSTFLPLTSQNRPEVTSDALSLLAAELSLHGVDEEVAQRAIASFQANGNITDA